MIRIYIDTDVLSPKVRKRGRTWYRMERELGSGRIERIENAFTFEEHNLTGATLEGVLDALSQIETSGNQIELYLPSMIAVSQIARGYEFTIAKRGYMTAKGKTASNGILWKGIVKHLIRTCRQVKCKYYTLEESKEMRSKIQFLKNETFDKARKSIRQQDFSEKKSKEHQQSP